MQPVRQSKHNMVISGGQQAGPKVLFPNVFFKTTAIRPMPVTTTMVLVLQVITRPIATPILMATIACRVP